MTGEFGEAQRRFREGEILRVAADVLADVGCRALTMNEVAARLGVSKATVYRHFDTREALIRQVVQRATRDVREEARREPQAAGEREGLVRLATYLAVRCLTPRGTKGPRLCCLAEVACPFLDMTAVESLFPRERSSWPGGGGLSLGRCVLPLSAAVAARRRTENRNATQADISTILRVLFPGTP